ncbi:PTS sugar transporter subunit IIA [Oceanivirga miroungae]|uniref:PTS transporter subunit IIA-like nitrogen-regulatory protein PtsN n=1 Tax=Oceanivirga miroungae TaxID=1130046 RepID=A0A6I8MDB1_9FUSO|nr:PTS sugar transporter subunit IIA [Oceanivirga miroungae]VWL85143.1 PTS transporter subunit IIA-like nitrogen-regulatory protein PtsN [Oceanivirga miroungae]
MEIKSILDESRIIFDVKANEKDKIIEEIAKLFTKDEETLKKLVRDIMEREKISSTGMQDGIAIPHCKSKYVNDIKMAVAISREGKEFNSMDGIATRIFFMIVAPENAGQEHLEILRKISKLSFEEDLLEEILEITSDKSRVISVLEQL